jgi:coenzyme F420-0:L-glutamate ligase/coenzyme F420-1:gamma-L-glutamate ligase
MKRLEAIPLRVSGDVRPGDSLLELMLRALRRRRLRLRAGDIIIVKHKIVSKAEGRIAPLAAMQPGGETRAWAKAWKHDARLAELAIANARRVVRMDRVLITETPHGFICANSGVDLSNMDGGSSAVLLPEDPDASARRLHLAFRRRLRLHIPVIIADSFGRPWREGLTEAAIGIAGLKPLRDYRGMRDPHGYELHATCEAVADEMACIAGLVCGKLEGTPACLIRGYPYLRGNGSAQELIRPAERDLFR